MVETDTTCAHDPALPWIPVNKSHARPGIVCNRGVIQQQTQACTKPGLATVKFHYVTAEIRHAIVCRGGTVVLCPGPAQLTL